MDPKFVLSALVVHFLLFNIVNQYMVENFYIILLKNYTNEGSRFYLHFFSFLIYVIMKIDISFIYNNIMSNMSFIEIHFLVDQRLLLNEMKQMKLEMKEKCMY
ncbi:hypothetical protein ACJX0J_020647 [Zea mays]